MIASFKKLSTIFLNSNTNPWIYSPFIFHGTSTSFKETFYKVIEYYKPRIKNIWIFDILYHTLSRFYRGAYSKIGSKISRTDAWMSPIQDTRLRNRGVRRRPTISQQSDKCVCDETRRSHRFFLLLPFAPTPTVLSK